MLQQLSRTTRWVEQLNNNIQQITTIYIMKKFVKIDATTFLMLGGGGALEGSLMRWGALDGSLMVCHVHGLCWGLPCHGMHGIHVGGLSCHGMTWHA